MRLKTLRESPHEHNIPESKSSLHGACYFSIEVIRYLLLSVMLAETQVNMQQLQLKDSCLQEAILELRNRIAEFNACIPYSGIASSIKPEPALLQALLSLLPSLSSGFSTPRSSGALSSHLSSKDTIHIIDLFHCLQRLATSTFVAAAMININGKYFSLCSYR